MLKSIDTMAEEMLQEEESTRAAVSVGTGSPFISYGTDWSLPRIHGNKLVTLFFISTYFVRFTVTLAVKEP